ncbi:MAG: FHA domain-containing protein [Ardenticatenaceae bacterium]
MLRFVRGWLLLLVLVSLFLIMSSVQAQVEPALVITKIDEQNFPEVKVYLRGDNLGQGVNLAELRVRLFENGQEVAGLGSEVQDVGTQTALLLDASGSVSDPGVTGVRRHIEVGLVARELVQSGVLTETDWLAAYTPDTSGDASTIHAWTKDHQRAADQLYTYQPPENIDLETPLFDLIYFALNRFDQQDVPKNTAKRIVLFSDGITGSSDLDQQDAIDRAVAEKVPVYTVLLGPETEEGRRNMNRIAKLTGGQAYQMTSLEALDELWNSLGAGGEQHMLTYRSKLKEPKEVLASVTLPDGVIVRASKPFPVVELAPVQIDVVTPTSDYTVPKEGLAHDTPLEELKPKTLNIEVQFSWPDDFPRTLTRVEYVIGDKTQVPSEAPFNQVSFPIDRLGAGDYTIRVTAIDELGLKGESPPIPFGVEVMRPAAPIPTPVPAPTPTGLDVPGVGRVTDATMNRFASFLAVALGVLAVIIALRKPAVRERVREAVSNTVQAVTEPFRFNKGQASKAREVKATLTVQDPGRASSLSPTMNIYAGATTRIGRSSEYAEIVINDRRVSRLHCRMAEEPDGSLRLYDEGGASGTYVNSDPVEIDGRALQSGDLIHVGPVQFRFYYQPDNHLNNQTLILQGGNKTEPAQPIAPSPGA